MRLNIGFPVVRTDGLPAVHGHVIFWDGYIYLPTVLRWRALRARESFAINHHYITSGTRGGAWTSLMFG